MHSQHFDQRAREEGQRILALEHRGFQMSLITGLSEKEVRHAASLL